MLNCFLFKSFMIFYTVGFSGDTFTDGSVKYTMTSMNVPEPVMSLAVQPVSKDSGGQVSCFRCEGDWDHSSISV